jgi:hypothetical protein
MTAADEQRTSPIGTLYPYLQHRSPACSEGCVCGVRSAVLGIEEELHGLGVQSASGGPAPAAVPLLFQPSARLAVRQIRLLLRGLLERVRRNLARGTRRGAVEIYHSARKHQNE